MGKNRRSSTPSGKSFEERRIEAGDDPYKIAELYGFKFSENDDGSWEFYDSENDFTLTITSKAVTENKEYSYMLNRMVELVSKLPEMNRKVTPGMYIVDSFGIDGRNGEHCVISNKQTKEKMGHNVAISAQDVFGEDDDEILRIMFHETNHAFDYMMGDIKSTGGISSSKEFKKALKLDGSSTKYADTYKYKRNKNGEITGEYSEKSLYRKDSRYLIENYAEVGSIVQMKMMGYGSTEIYSTDDSWVSVDDWVDSHPHLYNVVKDKIENFNEKNFKKTENVSNPVLDKMYINL